MSSQKLAATSSPDPKQITIQQKVEKVIEEKKEALMNKNDLTAVPEVADETKNALFETKNNFMY